MSVKQAEDAVATATDHVREMRAQLAEWREKIATSEQRLVELQDVSGEDVLADPGIVDRGAAEMVQLRAQIEQYGRAVETFGERVHAAELGFFAAEAVRLEAVEVAPAEKAWSAHQAKVEALQVQLEELEGGRLVAEQELLRASQTPDDGPRSYRVLTSERLAGALNEARRRLQVLQTLAGGDDPARLVDEWTFDLGSAPRESFYPVSVWGPDAVACVPEYAGKIDAAARLVDDIESGRRELMAEIETLQVGKIPLLMGREEFRGSDEVARALEARESRLEGLQEQLRSARAALTEVAGDRARRPILDAALAAS